jgi:hypothetical protein
VDELGREVPQLRIGQQRVPPLGDRGGQVPGGVDLVDPAASAA